MSTLKDSVQAFSQLLNEDGHQVADGPLKGYQFAVKDVFDVKGFKTQAGNPDYFTKAKVSEETAPAVSIMQSAGAKLVGKTHTDELGASLFGINKHYGTPINSIAPDSVPGGSSSGSASAVAAKLVDFALGADTSGSVRAPASFCGIYGLRPTLGRISTQGVLPISQHLDTVGIFAREPEVIAQVLEVYGINERAEFKRLRVIPSLVGKLEGNLLHGFKERLNSLPLSQTPLMLEDDTLTKWSSVIRTIAMYDLWQVHKEWILQSSPSFGDLINDRINLAKSISYEDYRVALSEQKAIREFMDCEIEPGDIVTFPTVHDVPPLLNSTLTELKEFALKTSRHTCIAALTGFPEITTPLKLGPLGMSFLGRPGQDCGLTTFAAQAQNKE